MAESNEQRQAVDLTISIATWNNCDLAAECLRSLEDGARGLAVEVFVVDNASTDGTVETIAERFPSVRLIRNERPEGFSANHNRVLRKASGRFVALLNDDTVVLDDALARAVRFLEEHEEAGAAGCTLVKPDGTPERISQRFPHPLDPIFPSLREKVPSQDGTPGFQPADRTPNRDPAIPPVRHSDPDRAVEVDRLSGACLMVRREVLDRVGLLDEQFDPAYCEDTDFCYRIKEAGWRIFRLPGARVVHYRGRTAGREFADQARRLQEAKFRWYRKHRSRGALRVYRFAVIIASVGQLVAMAPRLLLPRRREETRARLARILARLRASLASTHPR